MSRERGGDGSFRLAARLDAVAWRAERLEEAGFEPAPAREVARDTRIDIHAILDLIDRGCPPDLAVRILAPLD